MPSSSAERDFFSDRLLMTAVLLALPPLATIVAASMLYHLGLPALISGLIISYAAVYGLFLFKGRDIYPVGLSLSLTVFSLFLGSLFYDASVDGRMHLQEAVIHLARGWNPVETEISVTRQWWGTEWINYYPIGFQILGAVLYQLTGSIQAAKGYNFILLFAAASAAWAVLRSVIPSRLSAPLALALTCNPIVMAQLWTFYIDGSIYLVFLIALCLLLQVTPGVYFNDKRPARDLRGQLILTLITASILVLPVIKISCFALALFLYLMLIHQLRSRRKLIALLSAAGMVLFYFVGYKPFFMYESFEIMARLGRANPLPYGINGHNPLVSQLLSYFGTPAATYEASSVVFFSTDYYVRFNSSCGLYGVIFGFIWIWSLGYFFKSVFQEGLTRVNRFFLFLFVITNLTPVIFPMFINQRYYPIQYIFPVAMLARYCSGSSPIKTALGAVIVGAVLINPFGVLADAVVRNMLYTGYINDSLARLAVGPRHLYRQVAVEDNLSAFRPSRLLEQVPGIAPPASYVSQAVVVGDELSASRLSRMLSDRLFFKDLGEPIFMPTHEVNRTPAMKRFHEGRVASSEVLINDKGVLAIIQRNDDAPVTDDRAEIMKLDLEAPAKSYGEVMMYLQADQGDAFSLNFDRYFRWSVTPGQMMQYLDIPGYARRVLILTDGKMKIKRAELREVELPEIIPPQMLSLP